jgi:hypothetical protein
MKKKVGSPSKKKSSFSSGGAHYAAIFNPKPPSRKLNRSRPVSGKSDIPNQEEFSNKVIEDNNNQENDRQNSYVESSSINHRPITRDVDKPLQVKRNWNFKVKPGPDGGVIVPMDVETSELKKRLQKRWKRAQEKRNNPDYVEKEEVRASPKKPCFRPIWEPSLNGEEDKYATFEEYYKDNVMQRIECKPSDYCSMAGLQNGGECVFLWVYDISFLNTAIEMFGFGFYHTSVQIYDKEYYYGGHDGEWTGIVPSQVGKSTSLKLKGTYLVGYTFFNSH